MKKKILFGGAAVIMAIAGIVASKANPPLPDYYIDTNDVCQVAPTTNCQGSGTCTRFINTAQGTKQIFDRRVNGACLDPLNNPTAQ